jgi:tRNA (guanine10-N2)-methyltransferase
MGSRRVVNDYALPKRIFIGPTSMDAELAFIICNLAKVGDLASTHA